MRKSATALAFAALLGGFLPGMASATELRLAQAHACPQNIGGSYSRSCGNCTVDSNCNMTCDCDGKRTSTSLIACAPRSDGVKYFCNRSGQLRCGESC